MPCAPAHAIRNLLELDLKPRDIMTREAFENAMVLVSALGGSTNAVLHLIAMARAVEVPLTIDDFQASVIAFRCFPISNRAASMSWKICRERAAFLP